MERRDKGKGKGERGGEEGMQEEMGREGEKSEAEKRMHSPLSNSSASRSAVFPDATLNFTFVFSRSCGAGWLVGFLIGPIWAYSLLGVHTGKSSVTM